MAYSDPRLAPQAQGTTSAPPAAPLISQHAERLGSNVKSLGVLTERLHNVADRLLGCHPADPTSPAPTPTPQHSVGLLDEAQTWFHQVLEKLHDAVERLERL